MAIFLLLLIAMPLYIGWRVYDLFRRDLKFVRRVGKLKVGEYESMMRRHRIAIRVHAILILLITVLLFWIIGIGAIFAAAPFFFVFWAHSLAFQRFYAGTNREAKQKRQKKKLSKFVEEDYLNPESVSTLSDDGESAKVNEKRKQ